MKNKKTTRDYNRMEKKEAKRDRAKVVKNSGRGHRKGDAAFRDYLIDYKFNSKSFSLNLDNWTEHAQNAWKDGYRDPLIVVKFQDDTKLAIIDWDQFMFLKDFYDNNYSHSHVDHSFGVCGNCQCNGKEEK